MIVEFLEELFPLNFFEVLFVETTVSRKFEAQDTDVLTGASALYVRWSASTFFSPPADHFVIASGLRKVCHNSPFCALGAIGLPTSAYGRRKDDRDER